MSSFVTLVNRSSRTLSGTWDGRTYEVTPGKHALPPTIAEAIKRRNPIMGSDDLVTGQLAYLIGIEEYGDPTTPIEQSDEIELFNRRQQKNAVPIMIIPGNTGTYSVKRNDMAPLTVGGPAEAVFVKP